jgi:hypothetical protein
VQCSYEEEDKPKHRKLHFICVSDMRGLPPQHQRYGADATEVRRTDSLVHSLFVTVNLFCKAFFGGNVLNRYIIGYEYTTRAVTVVFFSVVFGGSVNAIVNAIVTE